MITTAELEHVGSLITQNGQCLGHLIHFPGKGTYEPTLGLLDISAEDADTHNKLLDQALLDGLDNACQLGQGGFFYRKQAGPICHVHTFMGILVSDDVTITGDTITFRRNGRTFRGQLDGDGDVFNFKRIS